jgi:hypothetical protein
MSSEEDAERSCEFDGDRERRQGIRSHSVGRSKDQRERRSKSDMVWMSRDACLVESDDLTDRKVKQIERSTCLLADAAARQTSIQDLQCL